jgi:prefoldin subunit 5
MTDNQSNKLDEIIEKLQKVSEALSQTSENLKHGFVVTVVTTPTDKLDKIIQMLTPMAENVQAIRQQLADTEQEKKSPSPPQAPPTQT